MTNRAYLAFETGGTKLVAADSGGQIYTANSTSFTTSGVTGSLVGSQYAAIELQFIGNGQFIPLNSAGSFSPF